MKFPHQNVGIGFFCFEIKKIRGPNVNCVGQSCNNFQGWPFLAAFDLSEVIGVNSGFFRQRFSGESGRLTNGSNFPAKKRLTVHARLERTSVWIVRTQANGLQNPMRLSINMAMLTNLAVLTLSSLYSHHGAPLPTASCETRHSSRTGPVQHQRKSRVGIIQSCVHLALDSKSPIVLSTTVRIFMVMRCTATQVRYADVPAMLLGRLAIAKDFAGQGLGRKLLGHALDQALYCAQNVSGCRCVIVDAYPTAVDWYAKFGFVPIEGASPTSQTQKMFLDLRTIKAAKETVAKRK